MRDGSVRLELENLSCAGCAGRAEKALNAVSGVEEALVNFATSTAIVKLGKASLANLVEAVDQAGYPVVTDEVVFQLEGMHCASCVGRVEYALQDISGVLDVDVNLVTVTVRIRFLRHVTGAENLKQILTQAGYPVVNSKSDQSDQVNPVLQAQRMAVIASLLAVPVFVLEMGAHVIPGFAAWVHQTIGAQTAHWIEFLLTTLILIWPGRGFFMRGVPALFKAMPEMNSLVALGTSAAWGYSTLVLLIPSMLPENARAVYFEAAAVIVALVLIGRWLEARAKGQAGAAIRALLDLNPAQAWVQKDGAWVQMPTEQVMVGDCLQVRAGARIAVDGVIVKGDTWVDEAMITGEPLPVSKTIGDSVTGGTVNGNGLIEMQATAVGRDTVLSRIVATVETAQSAKLPVQAMADRVIRVFVPAILVIAALTVLGWLLFTTAGITQALVAAVSVLIIACPCAMGLAVPTSIMVGTGRAAELGVLFRKGDALQRLEDVKIIAFDKTGTLTCGEPQISDVTLVGAMPENQLRQLVTAVESASDHPIAQAVVAWADVTGGPVAEKVETLPGFGVVGRVGEQTVLVGAERLMERYDIPLETTLFPQNKRGSALYVAVDGALEAVLTVSDQIKPDAQQVLQALSEKGLTAAMITGDALQTATDVARQLGIEVVEAGVLPEGKASIVHDLRQRFGAVAFVGDGINDGPALAAADVGLAIGGGTDVAIESADIVLLSNQLAGVLMAVSASRKSMKNIRQNLFWAFAYNTALIPVAAFGLISPMLAAGAMAMSSVFVVCNALRLRRLKTEER